MRTALILAALLLPLCAHAQQFGPPLDNYPLATSCTGTCTTAVVSTSGYTQVALEASGSGSGLTFHVEGKQANGAAWHTLPAVVPTTPGTFVTSMSANGYWVIPTAGFQSVRVNLSAIGGGTETFALAASVGNNVNVGQ
jgi:hypothetical protein